jgi:hypothetical protein
MRAGSGPRLWPFPLGTTATGAAGSFRRSTQVGEGFKKVPIGAGPTDS